MSALAAQDQGEAVEFIYVEHPDVARDFPEDLKAVLPRFRMILEPSPTSYGLRNAGVRAATTPWVAMLDADCLPGPAWLQRVSRSIHAHPSAAVISGRTRYPGAGLMERIMALLSRSYLDRGKPGRTEFISHTTASSSARFTSTAHCPPEPVSIRRAFNPRRCCAGAACFGSIHRSSAYTITKAGRWSVISAATPDIAPS